ncbi:hypothetical protein Syun_019002 [Stephania yunnanensis]|uniref:Uncharacterized protein n=1 Tax=Stephania yunnanensis TaxID=152371 RepID=A0AAP0ITY6_9MAGN
MHKELGEKEMHRELGEKEMHRELGESESKTLFRKEVVTMGSFCGYTFFSCILDLCTFQGEK